MHFLRPFKTTQTYFNEVAVDVSFLPPPPTANLFFFFVQNIDWSYHSYPSQKYVSQKGHCHRQPVVSPF